MVARTVAARGLSVLLVDVKKDITRVFRSCCCNLIIEPGTHKETATYEGGRICFANNGFSVPYSGAVIPLKNSFKISPGGEIIKIDGKSAEGNVAISYEKEVLVHDLFFRHQGAEKCRHPV